MGRKRKAGGAEAEAAAEASASPNTITGTWGTVGLDRNVLELCDKFEIAGMHAKRLHDLLQSRPETYESDLIRLWTDLEEARQPNGLIVALMNQMQDGSFVGQCPPDKELEQMLKRYQLDKEARKRLSDWICRHPREKRVKYYEELEAHLAASNKPSACAMMLLRKIKDGESLGMPTRAPRPGRFDGPSARDQDRERFWRDRERDHDRGEDRERDRDRDGRDYDRRPERDRYDRDDRDRERDRYGGRDSRPDGGRHADRHSDRDRRDGPRDHDRGGYDRERDRYDERRREY